MAGRLGDGSCHGQGQGFVHPVQVFLGRLGDGDDLRLLAQDRRALDPKQYPHIRAELGIDPAAAAAPGTG